MKRRDVTMIRHDSCSDGNNGIKCKEQCNTPCFTTCKKSDTFLDKEGSDNSNEEPQKQLRTVAREAWKLNNYAINVDESANLLAAVCSRTTLGAQDTQPTNKATSILLLIRLNPSIS